jgi:hypothetical protein
MTLTAHELEQQRQKRFKQELREQELRRFAQPDRDMELSNVWVAHVWAPENGVPDKGEWVFAGFRRRRNRRKTQTMGRFFSKVRRQLGIDKKAPVMLMDLDMASRRIRGTDQAWRFRAPQFQAQKTVMAPRMPQVSKEKRKQRATEKAYKLSKHNTQYIALGRMGWNKALADGTIVPVWDKKPGYLYLGPLQSATKSLAQREAKRLYPVYKDLLIVSTDELSKPLRQAMASGKRVSAGITRIRWPEVPPTFDGMYAKYLKKYEFDNQDRVAHSEKYGARLRQRWMDEDQPWITVAWFRKSIRAMLTPSKVIWKNGAFHCTSCWSTAKRPTLIGHTFGDCVPTTLSGDQQCADAARLHAKRKDDRKRKRLARRADAKKIETRRHVQKLAARKRRRQAAKLKLRSSRSRKLDGSRSSAGIKHGASSSRLRTGGTNSRPRSKSMVTRIVHAVLPFIQRKTSVLRKTSARS